MALCVTLPFCARPYPCSYQAKAILAGGWICVTASAWCHCPHQCCIMLTAAGTSAHCRLGAQLCWKWFPTRAVHAKRRSAIMGISATIKSCVASWGCLPWSMLASPSTQAVQKADPPLLATRIPIKTSELLVMLCKTCVYNLSKVSKVQMYEYT